ncbi:MAG: hypothetical protein DME14_03980 [Candidatus Rokuibacteriota bacterium]|nr:MAG: hypothetical protein DME14_03980 [Candidatus Rokubacteria bacterium]
MKTVSRHILWPVMLIVLSSVPAQAVNGFYYPTPSWDQKLPGSARFVLLSDWNNEAVLDRETGLVWQKAPDAFKTSWTLNDQFCNINNPSRGNRFGWRLPTSSELTSLIEWQNGVVGSFIILPPGHPFVLPSVQGDRYWTSDQFPSNRVLIVTDEGNGHFSIAVTPDVLVPGLGWCVRGGR